MSVICDSIAKRSLISATYHGLHRVLEPYCHGTGHNGSEMLVAYQREGGSASGSASGWKALVIAELDDLQQLDLPFMTNRDDYVPARSKNLAFVHCCV